MTVYERIDKILDLRKMSRRQLAKAIDIPPSTLQSMFARNKSMPLDIAENIANALEISFQQLVGASDEPLNYWVDKKGAEHMEIMEQKEKSSPKQDEPEITFDDFTYALYGEAKELTEENKQKLLEMAKFFKQQQDKEK